MDTLLKQMAEDPPKLVGNVEGKRRHRLWVVGYGLMEVFAPFASIFSPAYSVDEAEVALFTGGADISPSLYQTKNVGLSHPNERRDHEEVAAFHELRSRNIPMIGICRGAQLLNVLSGGTMFQDVNGHRGGQHPIYTKSGESFMMPSLHHQMMRPRGNSVVLAWTKHLSKHYFKVTDKEDHPIPELPYDPEIVWYPDTKCLCIQGHPEFVDHDHPVNGYVRRLALELLF